MTLLIRGCMQKLWNKFNSSITYLLKSEFQSTELQLNCTQISINVNAFLIHSKHIQKCISFFTAIHPFQKFKTNSLKNNQSVWFRKSEIWNCKFGPQNSRKKIKWCQTFPFKWNCGKGLGVHQIYYFMRIQFFVQMK